MKRLFLLPILLLFWACDNGEPYKFPQPSTSDCCYYPLDSGLWREFRVVEITIDEPISLYDTVVYLLREEFTNIYIDNVGDTLRQIERFKRPATSEPWQRANTWLGYKGKTEIIQAEENIRYIKIQMPLVVGQTWNGNAYNRVDTLNKYKYKLDSVSYAMKIGDFCFDSVITISQRTEQTAITKVSFFERYASGVGLVEKQQIDIYSDNYNPTVNIESRITRGKMVYFDLINFGTR